MILPEYISYQLHIRVERCVSLKIGKLGTFHFPKGDYIYTGSAKKNIAARVERHKRKHKPLRWHIDYLLSHDKAKVTGVSYSQNSECNCNQAVIGDIVVRGLGSSDCRSGCGSHLKLTRRH